MPRPMGRDKAAGAPRPKNVKGTIGRLLKYLKPHTGKMIVLYKYHRHSHTGSVIKRFGGGNAET